MYVIMPNCSGVSHSPRIGNPSVSERTTHRGDGSLLEWPTPESQPTRVTPISSSIMGSMDMCGKDGE